MYCTLLQYRTRIKKSSLAFNDVGMQPELNKMLRVHDIKSNFLLSPIKRQQQQSAFIGKREGEQ
jgi:hypothetical protein